MKPPIAHKAIIGATSHMERVLAACGGGTWRLMLDGWVNRAELLAAVAICW